MDVESGQVGIRRVVVGVDGSDAALDAARWAAGQARDLEVPLTLVHAVHLPSGAVAPLEPDDFAERQQAAGAEFVAGAANLLAAAYPELKIDTDVSTQPPIHRLVELSAPDTLVVTGTRGHGGFVGMLLGSVSRALAAHANGPLTVIRGTEHRPDGPVVLGIGEEPAEAVAEFAFDTAARHGTGVRAVRAWWPSTPLGAMAVPGGAVLGYGMPGTIDAAETQRTAEDEQAWAQQALAAARSRHPEVPVEIRAVAGNPVPALTEAAADAQMVVVGGHRGRGLLQMGAGYVVEGLLSHCPTPVTVIPVPSAE